MDETTRELIGDYELQALIGDGAQGRVYRARCAVSTHPHLKLDEVVALKVVRITGEDEKLRLKFQEQADILRRLSHANIVAYRDCFSWHAGEWDESQCLVMELLEGEPLSDRLKNANAGLPWPQVEEIFEQCIAGLIHARERGVTHRDLKPSNIFLTKDGKAKLIDFDIARRDDSGQMSTAGWKGTFDYMAPDFITINGFRGDEVSDIYSLGVCFYQSLTGSLPFEPLGETAHIGYLNRWRDNAAPVPTFRPGVFRVLTNAKAFVTRCLAAKREQRYTSFAAMLEEFRTIRYRRIRHKGKEEYELLAVLGRGGFGEVFKARRVSDGLLVAVKYLFSEKQSERFLKEAKILQQYPHANLVKYVDFMVLEGTAGEKQFFLVMEFLEGMPGWTLRPRLKNEGKLDVAEVIPLFSAYLSALQFLHENPRPIIHRDIKPGNLYAPVGQPEKGKIFDLGIARDVSGTVTVGGVPGTLDYMAPEFAEAGGDRGSPRSDLYALGLCLYEALAGKPVFDRLPTDLNSAWISFQDRIRKPPPVDFGAAVFAQYPRFKQIILKALAEKPEARFRSAAEMRLELENARKPLVVDDGFDAAEVTMATFAAGSAAHPSEPVTVGTRPLDPADLPDALDEIRKGRDGSPSRSSHPVVTSTLFPITVVTHKRLLVAGGIAALLLVGFGGVWLGLQGRKGQERREGQGAAVQPPASVAEAPHVPPVAPQTTVAPAQVPVKPSEVAPPASNPVQPPVTPLLSQPAAHAPEPVTSPAMAAIAETLAGLPARIAQAATPADLQTLVTAFVKLETSPGIQLTAAQIAPVEQAFAAKHLVIAKTLAGQAVAAFAADKPVEGAASQKALADLAAPLPARFGRGALTALEKEVAAARLAAEARAATAAAAAEAAAAARAKEVADAAGQADAVVTRVRKGTLSDSAECLQTLAAFTPAALADPGVKGKWEAARDALATVLEQAVAQKDPLDQRAQRLKTVEDAVSAPAAAEVFGTRAAALRTSLDQQKAVAILRLVNQGDTLVQVTSRELQGKTPLAGGEVKEWALAVPGEVLTVSVSVDGGNRFRSRIETIKLPHAGGLERAIGSLDAGAPAAAAPIAVTPAAKPAADDVSKAVAPVQAPAKPREVEPGGSPAEKPTQTAAGNAQPPVAPPALVSASSAAKAALEITLSPKTAELALDGAAATAGRNEVTPNENHKVSVSCPGYKPVQQYYKVRPGETRKIDILLEKEPKKSLFGF